MKRSYIYILAGLIIFSSAYGAYSYKNTAFAPTSMSEDTPLQNQNTPRMNYTTATYEAVETFNDVTELQYPDFSVRYTGEKTEKMAVNPNIVFQSKTFLVTGKDGSSQTVSWTSAGDVAPALFTVGATQYTLELMFSEHAAGKLADTELVIAPK